jgi:hypothetical protein
MLVVARAEAVRTAWGAESSRLGAFQIAGRAVCRRGANVFIVCPRRKGFGLTERSHSNPAPRLARRAEKKTAAGT